MGHPRTTEGLLGQKRAERGFLEAYRSGRLHHALLLYGPRGIGKATLAYRIGRFLLCHPDPNAPSVRAAEDLSVRPDHPVFRQVAAGAHPDLLAVEPAGEGRGDAIPVDGIRRLAHFFGSTAGAGGWRVAILDPAEALNAAAANALLKTLEEPPPRSLIVLVSHAPGRLAVTIRSRASRLGLAPLDSGTLATVAGETGQADSDLLARLSEGSVARYLALRDAGGLELYRQLLGLVANLPRLELEAVHAFLDGLGGREGRSAFRALCELILAWLESSIRDTASSAVRSGTSLARPLPGNLARWVELWEKTARSTALAETLNLDRKQALLPTFLEMVDISRGSPAPGDAGAAESLRAWRPSRSST